MKGLKRIDVGSERLDLFKRRAVEALSSRTDSRLAGHRSETEYEEFLGEVELADDDRPRRSVADICMALRLGRALAAITPSERRLLRRGSPLVHILCPEEDIDTVRRIVGHVVLGDGTTIIARPGTFSRLEGKGRLAHVVARTKSSSGDAARPTAALERALWEGYVVVGLAPRASVLPPMMAAGPDIVLTIEDFRNEDVYDVFDAIFGHRPTEDRLAFLEEASSDLSVRDLQASLSRSRGMERSLERLANIISSRPPRLKSDIQLVDLPGLGRAGEEMRAIAADLKAVASGSLEPEELVRGVVLHGPPGGGKTSLARALAATAGVPLVIGGLDKWQSTGEAHLGTTLKALRADFKEARENAPCVLLIDELDGFGRRDSYGHNHKTYSQQVVNGLLSELDGPTPREGVLVVGTTNLPEDIDPAIVRAGRFDQLIAVELPDELGRLKILRRYAPDIVDEALRPLAARAIGASGADLEVLVRRARSSARREGRQLEGGDLIDAAGIATDGVPQAAVRRAAIHEVGHALSAILLDFGVPQAVRLTASGGDTVIDPPELLTRDDVLRFVEFLLSGRAAEEIVFGSASLGAGGGSESDLARASTLLIGLESAHGLGGRLMHFGAPSEMSDVLRLQFAGTAEALLTAGYDAALDRLRRHRDILGELSEMLTANAFLGPDAFGPFSQAHRALPDGGDRRANGTTTDDAAPKATKHAST